MISKKSAVRWTLLAVTIGSALFGRCSTYISEANVITSGWPPCGPSPVTGYDSGSFYGYISSGNGAGDEAFERCLAMMRTNRWNRPLMVIYGHDTCSRCDVFASAANYFPTWRGNTKNIRAVKGYFRGKNDDSGPKACKDAYDFLIAHGVKKSEVCHGVGLYGEYEDGEKPFKFFPLDLNGDPHAIKDNFIATAKKWCEDYISNYSNHLVTVTWGFKPGHYEALPEVEALSVIIERTKQLDKADTNLLEVVYADGTTVTNQIEYAAGDGLEREIRIPLRDAEGGSFWVAGKDVKLTLFSAKGRSALKADPTKTILCIAAELAVNSPLYPSLPGKSDVDWGEWTFDEAVATTKVHAANSYLQPDTNATPFAVEEVCRVQASGAWSNRYETVYTNDLALFAPSEDVARMLDLVLVASNLATTVYTDELPLPDVETNGNWKVSIDATFDVVSNFVIRAGGATTSFWDAVSTTGTYPVFVTNVTTYAEADDGHPAGTTNVVETTEFRQTVPVGAKDCYFKSWRADDPEALQVIQSNLTWAVTNFIGYVFTDTDATNTVIDSIVSTNIDVSTTNFISYLLVEQKDDPCFAETNFTENGAYDVTLAGTNWYYQVTTNVYQHGDQQTHKGYAGRSEEGIQSALLRFTGGTVWDDDAIAFAQFLGTDEFKAWCALENVATLFIETAEPGTGASLFSYNVASNGNSGAVNISRRGLSIAECAAYAPALTNAEPFKLELVRPDGTLAGVFAPFNENGAYDTEKGITENLARLVEFLKLLDDRHEAVNNDFATPDSFAYDESILDRALSSLQMSDKIDIFKVTDVPANTLVSIGLNPVGVVDNSGLTADFVAGSVRVPPFGKDEKGNDVWRFTAAQAAGLNLRVQAWTNAAAATTERGGSTEIVYIPAVSAASAYAGKVGFVQTEVSESVVGEQTFTVEVERTGYTGTACATVRVDLASTTLSPSNYTLVGFKGNEKTFVWGDLENGKKAFQVKVKDVLWGPDISNLVFKVSCSGAALDETKDTCTLKLRQLDDPDALTGSVVITSPSVSGTLYVRTGDQLPITVSRLAAHRAGKTYDDARGDVAAVLTPSVGGFEETNGVTWASYRTGEQTLVYRVPEAGTAGKRSATITLKAVDEDKKNIAVAASNRVSLCVLPSDAPGFLWPDPSRAAVQYVEFSYLAEFDRELLLLVPERAEKVSGDALPSGIKATVEAGGIRFAGKPTKTTSCKILTSTWQVRFRRMNEKGRAVGYAYSLPLTLSIRVRALAESSGSSCGVEDAVNVGFATSRNWTDLPLTNGSGRLVGLLNLSATDKGAINARYRKLGGKTVAFPRANIDVWPSGEEGEYVVHANLANKGFTCDIDFFKDLSVAGSVFDDERQETCGFALPKGSKVWSKDHKADRWQGYYTLAFPKLGAEWDGSTRCFGVPTASARLATSATALANGKMTYAVTLPNGKSASGSAMLTPTADGAEATTLPIFVSNSSETFAALVGVMTNAGEKVSVEKAFEIGGSVPYWKHVESKLESASYENDYSVVGVRIAGLGRKFDWSPFEPRTEEDLVLKTKAINLTSGVVSGTMRDAANRSVSWKGVALPGFDPFVFGAFWRNVSEGGRTIRSGGAVEFVEKQAE